MWPTLLFWKLTARIPRGGKLTLKAWGFFALLLAANSSFATISTTVPADRIPHVEDVRNPTDREQVKLQNAAARAFGDQDVASLESLFENGLNPFYLDVNGVTLLDLFIQSHQQKQTNKHMHAFLEKQIEQLLQISAVNIGEAIAAVNNDQHSRFDSALKKRNFYPYLPIGDQYLISHLALERECFECLMILKRYQYDLDRTSLSGTAIIHRLMRFSASWNDTYKPWVKKLVLLGVDINRPNSENGNTPLMSALYQRNIDAASYLLEINANLTPNDMTGATPLMAAVESGLVEVVRLLVAKSEVNARDHSGRTAAHFLFLPFSETPEDKRLSIMKVLEDHGAEFNIKDENDLSVKAVARKNKYREYLAALEEMTADND